MWGMSRYQWMVLLAAWLGWGFDLCDSMLFNFVASNCVPTLLGLPIGSPEAKSATLFWTGVLTSLLLLGWATGGILFGWLCDRIGRLRTLMVTMLVYAFGTAACAFAQDIWMLTAFRVVASLGIGGEWAAGAAIVAEVVPEKRRVEAGALLYTAAPFGLLLATLVNFQVAGVWLAQQPATSWRYVFLFGLVPAAVALVVRLFLREPERWQAARSAPAPAWREIFAPAWRSATLWGSFVAIIALATWWSCNAFIPTVATGLARAEAQRNELGEAATLVLIESWKLRATLWFNLGGLIGTLLTIPVAKFFGRRLMFALYFAASAVAVLCAFGIRWPPATQLFMYFPIGLSVFGVFGSFTYYLPELYPTRLRASGAGFCYNIGRVIAAAGPFLVGVAAQRGVALQALFIVGFVPLVGFALTPFVVETRHRMLSD